MQRALRNAVHVKFSTRQLVPRRTVSRRSARTTVSSMLTQEQKEQFERDGKGIRY